MHPLRHPRNAALVGILFVVIGLVSWAVPYFGGWQVDYAGTTMLIILGIVFLSMQLIDYSLLGAEGLTLSSGPYGTTYYTLTGFHGAHVFGGVVMLSVILYRGMVGQFSGRHYDAVEGASLYWHFVDVVWILLFSLLYLLPGKTPTT